MHLNLYVKVGRQAKQCLGSFEGDEATRKLSADAAQVLKTADLLRSGVALSTVEFTREEVGAKAKGKK